MAAETAVAQKEKIGTLVKLSDITFLPDLQIREFVDDVWVKQIRQGIKDGNDIEPIDLVVDDEGKQIGADGQHRYIAHCKEKTDKIRAIVHDGDPKTWRSRALEISLSKNGSHGLHLTVADKRRAVRMALSDVEMRRESDKKIARFCRVSPALVKKMRSDPDKEPKPRGKKSGKPAADKASTSPTTTMAASPEPLAPPSGTPLENRMETVSKWIKEGSFDWPTAAEMFETKTLKPILLPKEGMTCLMLTLKRKKSKIPLAAFEVKRSEQGYTLHCTALE